MTRSAWRKLSRWPRTVHGRVVIAAVLATGVLLVIAGLLAVEVQERSLRDRLEASLVARATDVAALVSSDALPARLSGGGEHSAVQVLDPGGRVVAGTEDVMSRRLTDARPGVGERVTVEADGAIEAGHAGLLVVLGAEGAGGTYTVVAGEDFETIQRSTEVLGGILLVGLPLLLIAVGLITALAVRRALAPVERVRRELAAISSDTLDRRINPPGTRDEIARLAQTGNELLDRLEAAYRREQRFVADASHELRNPIATLRSCLELDEQRSATRSDLIAEVARLENLVDDLLHLARREEVVSHPREELLDLDDVVLEEVARVAVDGIDIDASGVSAAQVRGVRGDLVRLVRNLLDNAARYGGSRVEVSLCEDADAIALTIDDDGPGIPPDQREAVFERFSRVDRDRSRQAGGTGLGLAIAEGIVLSHRGAIEVSDAPGGGARMRVRLPAAAVAMPAEGSSGASSAGPRG